MLGFAFVAQREAAVSREPGHRSFDHSAVRAEFVLGFDAYRVFGSEDPNLSDAAQWGVTRNGGSVDGASCASAPMIGWYKKGTSLPE